MDIVFKNGETYRSAEIEDIVTVTQGVDLVTLKWDAAMISWASVGRVLISEAKDFSKYIDEAVKIAEKWTMERKGKPVA